MAGHDVNLRADSSTEERMRGEGDDPQPMFSYITTAQRVPQDHPLRRVRSMADEALRALSREFSRLYSKTGRPSIPPERLLRATFSVAATVRSATSSRIFCRALFVSRSICCRALASVGPSAPRESPAR